MRSCLLSRVAFEAHAKTRSAMRFSSLFFSWVERHMKKKKKKKAGRQRRNREWRTSEIDYNYFLLVCRCPMCGWLSAMCLLCIFHSLRMHIAGRIARSSVDVLLLFSFFFFLFGLCDVCFIYANFECEKAFFVDSSAGLEWIWMNANSEWKKKSECIPRRWLNVPLIIMLLLWMQIGLSIAHRGWSNHELSRKRTDGVWNCDYWKVLCSLFLIHWWRSGILKFKFVSIPKKKTSESKCLLSKSLIQRMNWIEKTSNWFDFSIISSQYLRITIYRLSHLREKYYLIILLCSDSWETGNNNHWLWSRNRMSPFSCNQSSHKYRSIERFSDAAARNPFTSTNGIHISIAIAIYIYLSCQIYFYLVNIEFNKQHCAMCTQSRSKSFFFFP